MDILRMKEEGCRMRFARGLANKMMKIMLVAAIAFSTFSQANYIVRADSRVVKLTGLVNHNTEGYINSKAIIVGDTNAKVSFNMTPAWAQGTSYGTKVEIKLPSMNYVDGQYVLAEKNGDVGIRGTVASGSGYKVIGDTVSDGGTLVLEYEGGLAAGNNPAFEVSLTTYTTDENLSLPEGAKLDLYGRVSYANFNQEPGTEWTTPTGKDPDSEVSLIVSNLEWDAELNSVLEEGETVDTVPIWDRYQYISYDYKIENISDNKESKIEGFNTTFDIDSTAAEINGIIPFDINRFKYIDGEAVKNEDPDDIRGQFIGVPGEGGVLIYDITDTVDEENPTEGLKPLPYIYSGTGMIELRETTKEVMPDEQRIYRLELPLSRQGFPNVPTKFKIRTITNILFAEGVNWSKTHISEREITEPTFEMDFEHTHEKDDVVHGYETYFELKDMINHSNVPVFTPTIEYTLGEKYNLKKAHVSVKEDYTGTFEDIFSEDFITYEALNAEGELEAKTVKLPKQLLTDPDTGDRYFEVDLTEVTDKFTIHYKDKFVKYEEAAYSIKLYGTPTKVGPLTNSAKLVFIEKQASNDELGNNTTYADVPHSIKVDSTINVIYPEEVKPETRVKVNGKWDKGDVFFGENLVLDFFFGVNNEEAETSTFYMDYNVPEAILSPTLTIKNQLFKEAKDIVVYAIDKDGNETKLDFEVPADGTDVVIELPEGTVANKITTGAITTDGLQHFTSIEGLVEKTLTKTHGITTKFTVYENKGKNAKGTEKPTELEQGNVGVLRSTDKLTLDVLYGTNGVMSERSKLEILFNNPHVIKSPELTISKELFMVAENVKLYVVNSQGKETSVQITSTTQDFKYKLPADITLARVETGKIKTSARMSEYVTIDGIIENGSDMVHRVDASYEVYQKAPYDKTTVAKAPGIINIELPDRLEPTHNIDVYYGNLKSNNVSYESIFDVYFRLDTKGVTSPNATYTIDLLKPSGEGYFDVQELVIREEQVVDYKVYDIDGREYTNEIPKDVIITKLVITYENFKTDGLEDIVTMKVKADIDMGSHQDIRGVFSGNQNKPFTDTVVRENTQKVTVFDTRTTVETKGVNQVDEKLGVGNKYSVDIFRHWGRGYTYSTHDYTLDQGYKSLGGFTTSLTRPTQTYANNDQTTVITTQLPEHFDMYYLKIRNQLEPYITDIKIYREVDGVEEVWQTVTGDQWVNNTQEGNFWRINTALNGNEGEALFETRDTTQDVYEHPYFKSAWHSDVRPEQPITKVEVTLNFERLSNDDAPQIGGVHTNVIEYMGRFHTTSDKKQQTENTTVDTYGVERDQTRTHNHSINSLVGFSFARTSTGAHDNTSLARKQILMGTIGEYKASIQNLETFSVAYWGGHGPDIYTPVHTEHDEWLQMRNSGFFHDTLIYEFTYPTRPSQDEVYHYAPEYFVIENTKVNKYLDKLVIYGEDGTTLTIDDIDLDGAVKVNYVEENDPEKLETGYEIQDGEIFVTLKEGETAVRFEAYFKHIQGFGERTAELDGTPQDQLGALSDVDVRIGGIVNGDKELTGTTKLYRVPDDSKVKTLLGTTSAKLVGITPKLNAKLDMTFDNIKVYDYGKDGIAPNTTTVDITIANVGEADITDVDVTFTPDKNFRTQTLRIPKEIFESDYWVDSVTIDNIDVTEYFELDGDNYVLNVVKLFEDKVLTAGTYKQNGLTFSKLDSRVIKVHFKPDAEKDVRMFGQFTKDAWEDQDLPSVMTNGSIMQAVGIWADQSETGEWDWTSAPSFTTDGTKAHREAITSYTSFNVSAVATPYQPIWVSSGNGNQGHKPTLTHSSSSSSTAAPRLYNRVSRVTLTGQHLDNNLELSKDSNLFYDADTDKQVSYTNLTVGDTTYVVYKVANTGVGAASDMAAGDNPVFKPYLEVNAPTGLRIVDAWTVDEVTDYITDGDLVKPEVKEAIQGAKQYSVTFDNTLEYGEALYVVVKFETVNDFADDLGATQNRTMVWQAYARPEKTHNFFSYNSYGADGHRTSGRTDQVVNGEYFGNVYNTTYRFANPDKLRVVTKFKEENVSGKDMTLTVQNIENETLHHNTQLEVEVVFDKNKHNIKAVQGNTYGGFEMTEFPEPETIEGFDKPVVYFEYEGNYVLATDFDEAVHDMKDINRLKVDYGIVEADFKAPNFTVEGIGHWKTLGSLTTKSYNIYSTAKLILTHDNNSEYSYLTEIGSGNVWKAIAQTELNLQAFETKDEAQGEYAGNQVGKYSYKPGESFYHKLSLLNINSFQGLSTNTPYGKADLINPVIYDKVPEYISYEDVEIKLFDIDGNERTFEAPEVTTEQVTSLDVGGSQVFANDRHNDGYGRLSTKEPSDTKHNKARETEYTVVKYNFKDEDLKRGERIEITYKATARKTDLPYATYTNGTGVFAPFIGWYGDNHPASETFKDYTMDMASLLHDVGVSGNRGHELEPVEFLSNSSSWTHGGIEKRKNATNTWTLQDTYYDASANKEKSHKAYMNEEVANDLHTTFGGALEEVYNYLTKARVNDNKVVSDERIMWAQNGMQLSRAWLYGASEMVPDVERKSHGTDDSNFYEHDGSLNHVNINRWGYTPYNYDEYTYAVDLHEEFTIKLHAANLGDRPIETGLKYTEILPVGISPYDEQGNLLGITMPGGEEFTYKVIQTPTDDKGYKAPAQSQEAGTYGTDKRDGIPYVIEVTVPGQLTNWFKGSNTGKYQEVHIRVRVDHRVEPNMDLGVHKDISVYHDELQITPLGEEEYMEIYSEGYGKFSRGVDTSTWSHNAKYYRNDAIKEGLELNHAYLSSYNYTTYLSFEPYGMYIRGLNAQNRRLDANTLVTGDQIAAKKPTLRTWVNPEKLDKVDSRFGNIDNFDLNIYDELRLHATIENQQLEVRPEYNRQREGYNYYSGDNLNDDIWVNAPQTIGGARGGLFEPRVRMTLPKGFAPVDADGKVIRLYDEEHDRAIDFEANIYKVTGLHTKEQVKDVKDFMYTKVALEDGRYVIEFSVNEKKSVDVPYEHILVVAPKVKVIDTFEGNVELDVTSDRNVFTPIVSKLYTTGDTPSTTSRDTNSRVLGRNGVRISENDRRRPDSTSTWNSNMGVLKVTERLVKPTTLTDEKVHGETEFKLRQASIWNTTKTLNFADGPENDLSQVDPAGRHWYMTEVKNDIIKNSNPYVTSHSAGDVHHSRFVFTYLISNFAKVTENVKIKLDGKLYEPEELGYTVEYLQTEPYKEGRNKVQFVVTTKDGQLLSGDSFKFMFEVLLVDGFERDLVEGEDVWKGDELKVDSYVSLITDDKTVGNLDERDFVIQDETDFAYRLHTTDQELGTNMNGSDVEDYAHNTAEVEIIKPKLEVRKATLRPRELYTNGLTGDNYFNAADVIEYVINHAEVTGSAVKELVIEDIIPTHEQTETSINVSRLPIETDVFTVTTGIWDLPQETLDRIEAAGKSVDELYKVYVYTSEDPAVDGYETTGWDLINPEGALIGENEEIEIGLKAKKVRVVLRALDHENYLIPKGTRLAVDADPDTDGKQSVTETDPDNLNIELMPEGVTDNAIKVRLTAKSDAAATLFIYNNAQAWANYVSDKNVKLAQSEVRSYLTPSRPVVNVTYNAKNFRGLEDEGYGWSDNTNINPHQLPHMKFKAEFINADETMWDEEEANAYKSDLLRDPFITFELPKVMKSLRGKMKFVDEVTPDGPLHEDFTNEYGLTEAAEGLWTWTLVKADGTRSEVELVKEYVGSWQGSENNTLSLWFEGDIAPGDKIVVEFIGAINYFALPVKGDLQSKAKISNNTGLLTPLNSKWNMDNKLGYTVDELDYNEDGSTSDRLVFAERDLFTYENVDNFKKSKKSYSDLDLAGTEYPEITPVKQGGVVTFETAIDNSQEAENRTYPYPIFYDELPRVDDTTMFNRGIPRNSKFDGLLLTDTIKLEIEGSETKEFKSNEYTIYVGPFKKTGTRIDKVDLPENIGTEEFYNNLKTPGTNSPFRNEYFVTLADFNKYASGREVEIESMLVMFNSRNYQMPARSKIKLSYDMKSSINAPVKLDKNAPNEDYAMWNSFAATQRVEGFRPQESNLAGAYTVELEENTYFGGYIWNDYNINGLKDDGQVWVDSNGRTLVKPDPTDHGINGVIVTLKTERGFHVDDLGRPIHFENNAWYVVDELTGETIYDEVFDLPIKSEGPLQVETETDYYGNAGYYVFSNIPKGKYYAEYEFESKYANYGLTTKRTHEVKEPGKLGSKTDLLDLTKEMTDEERMTFDIGIANQLKLGGTVFNDKNVNGTNDRTEIGFEGATVTLEDVNGNIVKDQHGKDIVTTTDEKGAYEFVITPMLRQYVIDVKTHDENIIVSPVVHNIDPLKALNDNDAFTYKDDTKIQTHIINLPLDELYNSKFKEKLSVSIGVYEFVNEYTTGNRVWDDINQDGIQDENEPGIKGQELHIEQYLDIDGEWVKQTFTKKATSNNDGFYYFSKLPDKVDGHRAGYKVYVKDLKPGYNITLVNQGKDINLDNDFRLDGTIKDIVELQEDTNTIDLGLHKHKLGTVSGELFIDANENGIQDESERLTDGYLIILERRIVGATWKQVTTEVGNTYNFTELDMVTGTKAYEYRVVVKEIPTWHKLTAYRQGDNKTIDSDFNEADYGKFITVATKEFILNDYSDYEGSLIELDTYTEGHVENVDLGLIELDKQRVIGDYLWYDADRDGLQGKEELPIVDLPVYLYRVNGLTLELIDETVTNELGSYQFVADLANFDDKSPDYNKPYEYVVLFNRLSRHELTHIVGDDKLNSDFFKASDVYMNAPDIMHSVVSRKADIGKTTGNYVDYQNTYDDLNIDGGVYLHDTIRTIGDTVFEDTNLNGVQDAGELGIKDIQVDLYRDGEFVETVLTDKDGKYTFEVEALDLDKTSDTYLDIYEYEVQVRVPSNYVLTTVDKFEYVDETDVRTKEVTLIGPDGDLNTQRDDLTQDAGFAIYDTEATLAGIVWEDTDENGIRDPQEEVYEGYTVKLYLDGEQVAETVTDDKGRYEFKVIPTNYDKHAEDYLVPYEFDIKVTREGNQVFTKYQEGTDKALDSNIGTEQSHVGTSDLFEVFTEGDVSSIRDDLTMGVGLITYETEVTLEGIIWDDADKDGLIEDEERLADRVVTLWKKVGDKWEQELTTVTQADGSYKFVVAPTEYDLEHENYLVPYEYKVSSDRKTNELWTVLENENHFDAQGHSTVFETFTQGDVSSVKGDVKNGGLNIYGTQVKLGGTVWEDTNSDGIMADEEERITGQNIVLWELRNGEWFEKAAQLTDNKGYYEFTVTPTNYDTHDLPLYEYKVTTERSGNQEFTLHTEGTDTTVDNNMISKRPTHIGHSDHFDVYDELDGKVDIRTLRDDLNMGIGIKTYDSKAKVGGVIWEDEDFDGLKEANEALYENYEVVLWKLEGEEWIRFATTLTDGNGYYEFEVEPTNYEFGHEDYLKPYQYKASITKEGYQLYAPYQQGDEVESSNVLIKRTTQLGYLDTFEIFKENDITSVKNDLHKNAGLKTYADTVNIGGYVWEDYELDGIREPFDEAHVDKTVTLWRKVNGEWIVIDTNQTDELGRYMFEVAPTNFDIRSEDFLEAYEYRVTVDREGYQEFSPFMTEHNSLEGEERHTGYVRVFDIFESGNEQSAHDDLTGDIGIKTYETTVKVGGHLWEDTDLDGIMSESELKHTEHNVELWVYNSAEDTWSFLEATETDHNGYYEFEVVPTNYDIDSEDYLIPYEYQARVEKQGNQVFAPEHQGDDYTVDSDVITEQDFVGILTTFDIIDKDEPSSLRDDLDRGAGKKTVDTSMILGDTVWFDENENGLQDADEQGLSGVKVRLEKYNDELKLWENVTDLDGNSEQVTTSQGHYAFNVEALDADAESDNYLTPYRYRVIVETPEGYEVTKYSREDGSSHTDWDEATITTREAILANLVEGNASLLDLQDDLSLDVGLIKVKEVTTKPPFTGVTDKPVYYIIAVVVGLVLLIPLRKRKPEQDETEQE